VCLSSPRCPSVLLLVARSAVPAHSPCSCNFIEWREGKLIYKRYASLYFIAYTDKDDNELLTLEVRQSTSQ
jgi:hypothetical protein